MNDWISTNTFWTIWLFVHLILAVGLLGALTHQAMAVALPVQTTSRRHSHPLSCGTRRRICHGGLRAVDLTYIVGSYIYTKYRIAIRIPLEAGHYYKTGGFFDFKEHVATLGLVLLPAYWYFWKSSEPCLDNARKGVTIVLAVMCWFLFIVGMFQRYAGFGS